MTTDKTRQSANGERARKPRSRSETEATLTRAIAANWRTHSDRDIADMLGVSPTTVGKHRRRLQDAGRILPRIETGQSMAPLLERGVHFGHRTRAGERQSLRSDS